MESMVIILYAINLIHTMELNLMVNHNECYDSGYQKCRFMFLYSRLLTAYCELLLDTY